MEAVRGPGWIQIPQGESWRSASPWVQHQFRGRAAGALLSVAGAQSSPRSESEDERSSAMLRMAFSMGARFPLGVMPMGWITFSLQPGGDGEGEAELQHSTGTQQEHSRNTAGM